MENVPSVRSTSAGRSSLSVRSVTVVPPSKQSLRTPIPAPPIDPPSSRSGDNKRSVNLLALKVNYILFLAFWHL